MAVIENFTFENNDTFDVLLIVRFLPASFYNLKMVGEEEERD